MVVTLSKPFKVGDKELTEIELKIETLTGADVMKCNLIAMGKRGHAALSALSMDLHFHIEVASAACGIDASLLQTLPIVDFMAVVTEVQGFLIDAG